MRVRVEETTTPAPATSPATRTLARLLPPPRPGIDKDVLAFRTSLFAPRRNFKPSSGKGRFDALLLPGPGVMQITVRVRFNFISGRQPGDDPFPGVQVTDPSEFQWDPAAELAYKTRFLTEIAPQWSGKFAFESTRSPHDAWKDVTVTPIVRIVEDTLTPHVVLDVHKRPDDVEPVTNFVRPRDSAKPLETYFTSDNLGPQAELDDPLNEKSIPVTKVHFKRGRTELDKRGKSELAPIVTQMSTNPKSHATLRGRASSDRKAGTTVQEGFKLNLRLSRERSRAVADALEAAGSGRSAS